MDNVPPGAIRYRRWPLSARMSSGLAVLFVVVAVVLGVVTFLELRDLRDVVAAKIPQLPSPDAQLPRSGSVRLVYAGKVAGVNIALLQLAGIGSFLAAIGAIACGTVSGITLRRRRRAQSEPR
jgi:hypothetical protein